MSAHPQEKDRLEATWSSARAFGASLVSGILVSGHTGDLEPVLSIPGPPSSFYYMEEVAKLELEIPS